MKKIFTLCACALMSMSIARAESVTVYIEDENEKEYKSYEADLTRDADGVYTISNFIDTGCPISFTFDSSVKQDAYTTVTLKGSNLYNYSGFYYVLDAAGDYVKGKIYDSTGSGYTDVDTPYLYVKSTKYSYVTRVDKSTYGYEYYACINFSGFDSADEYLPDYYLEFGFNPIGDDPVEDPSENETITLGDVTVKVCSSKEVDIAKSFTTALSVDSKNVYTIADFLNSGASLSFKFDPTVAVGSGSSVEFVNVETEDSYYNYVLDATGEYAIAKVYALEGDDVTSIYYPYIYNTGSAKSYTYVTHLDKATTGYEYRARFTVSGFDADGKEGEWYYLYMYFNGPVATGISDIVANDADAPVEYYNLNGQRVENPTNGLFIRKQGSKVEKVVIR